MVHDVPTSRANLLSVVAFYCFCSATMLVANKAAVVAFPYPNLLLCCQFIVSIAVPKGLGMMGYLKVDALQTKKVLGFLKAVAVFFATLFTSMLALRDLNVDTVIVFRSSLPLAVALGDFVFMQRELPGPRTWAALALTLGGAVVFANVESELHIANCFWAFCYWACMVADQLVLKHVVSKGPDLTTWGRVYYQNTLSLVPAIFLALYQGEFSNYMAGPVALTDRRVLLPVGLSCAVGCGISFAGFLLRKHVSALTFTVIGVTNKVATVLINVLLWDYHASAAGTMALLVCIGGASMYKQPPRKRSSVLPK